jgi:hypothetical protein
LSGDPAAAECARVRWRPEAQPVPLPGDVWAAIRLWLAACGRLSDGAPTASLAPGQYIFTPLLDLPQQGPLDRPAAWGLDRHLSCDLMLDNLRLYGRQVGLPDHKLTTLALRRTGLRLRLQAGDTAEQIKTYVDGRSTPRDLRHRLRLLPPLPPDPPATAQSAVPVADLPLPQRKGLPLEPGYGMKHGFLAHSQPAAEVQAVLGEAVRGVDAELAGLRRLARGLLSMQARQCTGKELGQLSQAYTLTATRLAMMVDAEKRLSQGGQSDNWAERVLAALDGAAQELGLTPPSIAIRAEALGSDAHLAASSRQLDEEIAAMRLVLRRTLALAVQAGQADDVGEYIHLVDIYSQGCNRLMRLLLAAPSGQGRLETVLRQCMDLALAEVQKDWTVD